jgi:hypothetical protein
MSRDQSKVVRQCRRLGGGQANASFAPCGIDDGHEVPVAGVDGTALRPGLIRRQPAEIGTVQ